jgi:hypothetical protein
MTRGDCVLGNLLGYDGSDAKLIATARPKAERTQRGRLARGSLGAENAYSVGLAGPKLSVTLR